MVVTAATRQRHRGPDPFSKEPPHASLVLVGRVRRHFLCPRGANLRNVELAAPHFHNGSAATLADVIDFYDRGGNFHTNQAPGLLLRQYDATDKAGLVAILRTLTDPRVAAGVAPFDRPLLGAQNGRIVTDHGPGTRSSSRRPVVAHAPLAPRAGEPSFSVTLSGVTPGAFTLLMWDTDPRVPDPTLFNLGLLTGPAFLCVAIGPALTLPNAPGIGVANVPLPLPATARGLLLYCQWMAFESPGWAGIVTSNSLRLQPW